MFSVVLLPRHQPNHGDHSDPAPASRTPTLPALPLGSQRAEAVNLTGLFIKSGPVVQVKEFNGRIEQDDDNDPTVLYDGPLMVLTSRFSASASEIVAGALQDYGRALVVGDTTTHGKGTVQTIQELGPFLPESPLAPGAIKVTIRKFYRASGESTQLKGVVPDIVLPSVNNLVETGESSLTNALPWDTIPTADFDKLSRVQPFLARLRDHSSNRIAGDRDWNYVREDVEIFRRKQAEKTLSLNYAQRVQERHGILDGRDGLALRHGDVERGEELLSLVFEEVHPRLPSCSARDRPAAPVSSEGVWTVVRTRRGILNG